MDALAGWSEEALLTASAVVLTASLCGIYYIHRSRSSSSAPSTSTGADKAASNASGGVSGDGARNPVVGVYFGTQTGTAEQFATDVQTLLLKHFTKVDVQVRDLEELGEDGDAAAEQMAATHAALILCSTYGDGEPPDTTAQFFDWLHKTAADCEGMNAAAMPLAGTNFAVFGLGNTQYEHFNASGKALNTLLERCGGERLMPIALGNDDDDIVEDFNKWTEQVLTVLAAAGLTRKDIRRSGERGSGASGGNDDAPAAYDVVVHGGHNVQPHPVANTGKSFDAARPFHATVTARRELQSKQSGRSTMHVEVELQGSGLSYVTGDHLGVYAENHSAIVEATAYKLGVHVNDVITVTEGSSKAARRKSGDVLARLAPNPLGHVGPLTVGTALGRYCDLLSPPRRPSLAALAAFANSAVEAKELRRLAGKEGKDVLAKWFKEGISLVEVLDKFPSVKVPLGVFLCSVAPRLQPRYYSISSSPLVAPTTPSLTVALVRETFKTGRLHLGVASSWLGSVEVGEALGVSVFVRSSTFRMPADPAAPLVLVGPGTGLAPFRGFLQERAALAARGVKLGQAWLFFGCRTAEDDYLYREELEQWHAQGVLSELHVAFSRQGRDKVYVQHLLKQRGKQVWEMLAAPGATGHLYVCGDAKAMARDVNKALLELLRHHGDCTEAAAEATIKQLTDSGRYSRDVW